jgi:hypothetical protein
MELYVTNDLPFKKKKMLQMKVKDFPFVLTMMMSMFVLVDKWQTLHNLQSYKYQGCHIASLLLSTYYLKF